MGVRLIIGPPGTGKTTNLLGILDRHLEAGADPRGLALVTYTKAAQTEALARCSTRFGLRPRDLPLVRTIHSLARQLSGAADKQVMGPRQWAEFGKANGYYHWLRQNHDPADPPSHQTIRTDADAYRYAYDLGRAVETTDLNKMAGALGWRTVDQALLALWIRRYEAYKREAGVIDFGDMLGLALESDELPAAEVALVDEAQDLSPAQIRLVVKWFRGCREIVVAGDDDQVLYGWNGASPDWIVRLSKRHPTTVLEQSHRIPGSVHGVAQRIIRQNKNRVPKAYRPKPDPGEAREIWQSDLVGHVDGAQALVLARNRRFLNAPAELMFAARTPFICERPVRHNPYGDGGCASAILAANKIAGSLAITPAELGAILAQIPSRGGQVPLPHGVKTRVENMDSDHKIGLSGLLEMGLTDLVDAIATRGPLEIMTKIDQDNRDYFADLIRKHGRIPEPKITLTTVHAAKGREADTVVVIPDMSRPSYRELCDGDWEAENRCAYVAVTRAKQRLLICQPETPMHYGYPA